MYSYVKEITADGCAVGPPRQWNMDWSWFTISLVDFLITCPFAKRHYSLMDSRSSFDNTIAHSMSPIVPDCFISRFVAYLLPPKTCGAESLPSSSAFVTQILPLLLSTFAFCFAIQRWDDQRASLRPSSYGSVHYTCSCWLFCLSGLPFKGIFEIFNRLLKKKKKNQFPQWKSAAKEVDDSTKVGRSFQFPFNGLLFPGRLHIELCRNVSFWLIHWNLT